MNLEDGGGFAYASANIDYNTVQMLINQLVNLLYTIGQVLGAVFSGNISNVSEMSLKLLFTHLDNKAKWQAAFLKQGFYRRRKVLRRLMKDKLTDAEFDSLSFSPSRPRIRSH